MSPGDMVSVTIEVARGSFVKRRPSGSVDFVSPLPCPYNYGSIAGTLGCDGDPLDAIVLGARLPYGLQVRVRVFGCIGFVDDGVADPKWVCGSGSLRPADRNGVERFFHIYAGFKRVLYTMRRSSAGRTACLGWVTPQS
ncbi:MAG: inorganic diphosphatase [Nannocystaceae bacterium]|nr:inorganic diphosphatase [Nannocystaceae bacterium]